MKDIIEIATFAGGCFWCTEAIFKRLEGVYSVTSGYSGGETENPTYEEVSSGKTGHAESIQIEFNPQKIPYLALLDVFWHTHNPTTLNQQGNDVGTQYRSVIFYHSKKQKEEALKSRDSFKKENIYKDSLVTQIAPFKKFYPAENYHKDYYGQNKDYPYCTFVINPKIQKLLKTYSKIVKKEYLEAI
jgi:peptide-methionine (S)-S-oxide reductase